jgi:hypothetical protein
LAEKSSWLSLPPKPWRDSPLDEKAVAYRYAEGAYTRLSGKKVSTVDIYTNIVAEASEVWTREFLEDATWNVMETMTEKVGRALGEAETNKILAMYGAIAQRRLGWRSPHRQRWASPKLVWGC